MAYKSKTKVVQCKVCGDKFKQPHGLVRYCSNVCRKRQDVFNTQSYWERHRERRRELTKAYFKKHPDAKRLKAARYRNRYPERALAVDRVHKALKAGKLREMPCEKCLDVRVHAHHDDYSKPLDVMWLCQKHHLEVHMLAEKRRLEKHNG